MENKLIESNICMAKISRNDFIEKIRQEAIECLIKQGRSKRSARIGTKGIFKSYYTLQTCIKIVLENNFYLLADMNEVKFGIDNVSICEGENIKRNSRTEQILGIHELSESIFCGCTASSSRELPVFFILYYDGNRFKGYIPKNGNCFDTNTFEAYRKTDETKKKYFIEPEIICNSILEATGIKKDDILINKDELSEMFAMISSINEDSTIKEIIDNYVKNHNL